MPSITWNSLECPVFLLLSWISSSSSVSSLQVDKDTTPALSVSLWYHFCYLAFMFEHFCQGLLQELTYLVFASCCTWIMKWVQGLIRMQSIHKFTMLDIPIPYNDMTWVQNTKIQFFHGTTHHSYKKYDSGIFHIIMWCVMRWGKWRNTRSFLVVRGGEERSIFLFYHLSSSMLHLNAYLTIEIFLQFQIFL